MSITIPSDSFPSDFFSFKNILTEITRKRLLQQIFQDSSSLSTVQHANAHSNSIFSINKFPGDVTNIKRLGQIMHATGEKGSTDMCKACNPVADPIRFVDFRSALLAQLDISTKITSTSCCSEKMSLPALTGPAAIPDSYAACLMTRQPILTHQRPFQLASRTAHPINSHLNMAFLSQPADPAFQTPVKGRAGRSAVEFNKGSTGTLPAHQYIGPFPSIQEQDAAGTGSWGRARQGHGPAAEAGGRKRPRSPDRSGARSERDGAAADRHCFKARRDGLGAPRPCRPPHRGRDLPDSSGPALQSALGSESVRCFGWAVVARAAVPQPPPGPADGASASAARISVWNLAG